MLRPVRAFLLVLALIPALVSALLVENHASGDGSVWLGWGAIVAVAVLVHLRPGRTFDPREPSLANLLLFSPLEAWAVDAKRIRVSRMPQHIFLRRTCGGVSLEIRGARASETQR